jgi:hypothetical protein
MLSPLLGLVFGSADLFPIRWFYVQTNLAVEQNANKVISVMERAKKAGYNGMVISDSKFCILDKVYKNYFDNAERVRLKAEELGLNVNPCVADMGYSSGLLSHNVNLIEGQPVKRMPCIVSGGVLSPIPFVKFSNSGLEESNGNNLVGFSFQDGPGQSSFVDTSVKHGGNQAIRFENFKAGSSSGNARIMHPLTVKPWQQYRVRYWLKTDGVAPVGGFNCFAIAEGGKVLSFMNAEAKPTQDWTENTIVFNSQNFEKVTLYTGLWGGTAGRFWLDDITVEEAGFLNVIRRSGAPISLQYDDGTSAKELDVCSTIEDKELGTTPWMGEYTFNHSSPQIRSRMKEGTKTFASFTHAVATMDKQVTICPSEPATQEILKDTMARVTALWKPKGLFLSHDEIRVSGQCQLCVASGKSPGQLYAEDLRQCVNLSRKTLPEGKTLVWSDMFDPYHNAVDSYYLSGGSWKDSWKGLTPDVTVMNWNSMKPKESLGFFAGLGCHQVLAGFYDSPVENIKPWLAAAHNVKGVDGVMYTTWVGDYSKLEDFAKVSFGK